MHYLFPTFTITFMFCALFVFYFNPLVFCALFVFNFHYYVGILRSICFLLSLIRGFFVHYSFSTFTTTLRVLLSRWCFAHYFFSTLSITFVFCALFFFSFIIRWCVAHHLFSTFTITVFCALSVFYFNYYVGVLRTICFILSL